MAAYRNESESRDDERDAEDGPQRRQPDLTRRKRRTFNEENERETIEREEGGGERYPDGVRVVRWAVSVLLKNSAM